LSSRNRYALCYLLGSAPDHGTRLPWLGLLPPRLQRLLTLGRIEDSGARLHSCHTLRRLARVAGFAERAAYAVMPDPHRPKRIIPLSAPTSAAFKGPGADELYDRRLEGILARVLPSIVLARLVYCHSLLLEKI
jgi:hypothetical protein